MHTNMNDMMVWAWALWCSDAAKHGRRHGLSVDAMASGCALASLVAQLDGQLRSVKTQCVAYTVIVGLGLWKDDESAIRATQASSEEATYACFARLRSSGAKSNEKPRMTRRSLTALHSSFLSPFDLRNSTHSLLRAAFIGPL